MTSPLADFLNSPEFASALTHLTHIDWLATAYAIFGLRLLMLGRRARRMLKLLEAREKMWDGLLHLATALAYLLH